MGDVAGVDGCKGGWVSVRLAGGDPGAAEALVAADFAALMARLATAVRVVVDMPVGLADGPSGREVEALARARIGPRRSSVFTPPLRPALPARSQAEATRLNRAAGGGGISVQAFNIIARIREIDGWITSDRQSRVLEGHPELAFATLAGRHLSHHKKRPEGRADRAGLLTWAGFDLPRLDAARPRGVAPDDLLDACILALTARRVASGTALRLPEVPARDRRGLRMEMWA